MLSSLKKAMQHNSANDEQPSAECFAGLMIIDIRDFRELNRSFGNTVGNEILQAISLRLHTLPAERFYTFYLGGDEFGIVLPALARSGLTILCAEQVLALFRDIFEADNHTLKITVNCGLAYNYGAHENPLTLLYDAEDALQQAKIANQPYQLLGTHHQPEGDKQKWLLLNDLHNAMQDDELSLYYQPKIALNDNSSTATSHSAEALIRWESDAHGLVAPNITLPLIEHLGSEIDLIRWLLNTALKQLTQSDNNNGPAFNVSVNIPAATVTSKALFELVGEALTIWNVDPERLTLEITEDILIKDKELAFDYLSKVRDTGVKIAIDDFGTGYSSLAYFKHLPADEIKIDQLFIRNMLKDQADHNLVKWIIELAHAFNLSVVAEGVEDEATLDMLKSMGCNYAQGFYIARPLPYQQYLEWLDQQ
jgi:diguanylate cyclase (GGDEF)-like protein